MPCGSGDTCNTHVTHCSADNHGIRNVLKTLQQGERVRRVVGGSFCQPGRSEVVRRVRPQWKKEWPRPRPNLPGEWNSGSSVEEPTFCTALPGGEGLGIRSSTAGDRGPRWRDPTDGPRVKELGCDSVRSCEWVEVCALLSNTVKPVAVRARLGIQPGPWRGGRCKVKMVLTQMNHKNLADFLGPWDLQSSVSFCSFPLLPFSLSQT